MNYRIILIIFFTLFSPSLSYAIDAKQVESLVDDIEDKKYEKVEEFLNSSDKELAKDPEYYVVLLNYIVTKANQKSLVVAKGAPQSNDIS